jgi:Zn ribbon nucleic-acid-binding protein
LSEKMFTRKVEDFECDNCTEQVKGNGYTNHCPNCLYSKHVDINPGDRASNCKGLMKPIGIAFKRGNEIIIHECIACGHRKNNRRSPLDNTDLIIKLSSNAVT